MASVQAYGAVSGDQTIKPMKIEREQPKANEVFIEIQYCGLCHSDLKAIENPWGNTLYPLVPGHEAVGRVLSVGSSVSAFGIDDMVGVGCMIDSCLSCSACREGWENHCESSTGPTMTYGGFLYADGSGFNTFGAWSSNLVVREEFVLKLPEKMDPARAAPLLCPGVAVYGPLTRFNIQKGDKIGIVGIGGPGHIAIQIAKAMGAEVTAFTTHEWKGADALKLGADNVVLSTDIEAMARHKNYFQHILSTIPNAFDPTPYFALIRRRGTMTAMGLLGPYSSAINNISLAAKGLSLTGSVIGSIKESREVLEFCSKNNILPTVEIVKPNGINEAIERLKKADVRFRFVIDFRE